MLARLTILFPLVLAAVLALLTFWVSKTVEMSGRKSDPLHANAHDYMLSHFSTTKTDANGNVQYVLAAAEMTHFPENDRTVLQLPKFTQFSINKPYTQIQGLRGYVSSNGEIVEVVDDVKVTRQAFEDKGEMQLLTEKLLILPKQEIVQTNSPVTITQAPKTVVHAIGMVYNKKQQTFTLLKKVRAHYERPKPGQPKIKVTKAATPLKATPKKSATTKSTLKKNPAGNSSSTKGTSKNPVPKTSKFKDNSSRIRRTYE